MHAVASRRHDTLPLATDELAAMLALPNLSPADKAAAVALLLVWAAGGGEFDVHSNQLAGLFGSVNGLDRLKSLDAHGYFPKLEHGRGKGWYRLTKGDWAAANQRLQLAVAPPRPLEGPCERQPALFAEPALLRVVSAEVPAIGSPMTATPSTRGGAWCGRSSRPSAATAGGSTRSSGSATGSASARPKVR